MGLVGWAQSLGLEILCGGHTHNCVYDPAAETVTSRGRVVTVSAEDRWALSPIPGGQAPRFAKARRRLFAAFRPDEECGDPLCHMAVAANGTGLLPDLPVGRRPVARWSELPEVLTLSDRILVLRQGRMVGELSRADANQERLLRLMAGLGE
jgi:predicted homoserine dehydrogenase-like protein